MTAAPEPRTGRGLERLINFTDAAAAIAITLLVLPLVDLAAQDRTAPLGDLLRDNSDTFIAFAVTFVVIGRLWLSHHQLFERLRTYDTTVIWLDLVWLACIVVLPFAAQELSNLYSSDHWVFVLYIGVMAVSSAALAMISARAGRRPALRRAEVADLTIALWTSTAILLLALVLSVVFPRVGMFWLLLLFAGDPIERRLSRRRARRLSQ